MKKLYVLIMTLLLLCLSGCAPVTVTNIAFDKAEVIIASGQSVSVTPVYTYSKEQPSEKQIISALEKADVKWQSSDESVALINKGEITAKTAGSAVITAKTIEGVKAELKIKVIVPVKEIKAEKEITLDLLANKTGSAGLSVMPQNASGVEISYASSNEKVASVNEKGEITPISEGEAEITAAVKSDSETGRAQASAKTKVVVKKLPQGIELESAEGILYTGGKYILKPYTIPKEAPESTYTYKTGDESIAAVDEKGEIKAIAAGKCEITVTSAEGHKAVYALTVTQPPKPTPAPAAVPASQQGAAATGSTGGAAAPPAESTAPSDSSENKRHRQWGQDCTWVFSHEVEDATCLQTGLNCYMCHCGLFTFFETPILPCQINEEGKCIWHDYNLAGWCPPGSEAMRYYCYGGAWCPFAAQYRIDNNYPCFYHGFEY